MDKCKNSIRKRRTAAGISVAELANRMGTSPQQIERWEEGQGIGLRVAEMMGRALQCDVHDLLPGLRRAMIRVVGEDAAVDANPSEAMQARLEAAGVDLRPAPTRWHLSIKIKGREEAFDYQVDLLDAERVSAALATGTGDRFATFRTCDGTTVGINARCVDVCRSKWSQPEAMEQAGTFEVKAAAAVAEEDEDLPPMRVFQDGRAAPIQFLEAGGIDEVMPELAAYSGDGASFVSIVDEEGERVMLRTGGLALVEVPSWIMEMAEESDHRQPIFGGPIR